MKKSIVEMILEFIRQVRRSKRWQRAVTCVAALVVFVTTYALILPAITMEGNHPRLASEKLAGWAGDAMSVNVSAESPAGSGEKVVVLTAESVSAGLSEEYEFDAEGVAVIEDKMGQEIRLHRTVRENTEDTVDYWFVLAAGQKTEFTLDLQDEIVVDDVIASAGIVENVRTNKKEEAEKASASDAVKVEETEVTAVVTEATASNAAKKSAAKATASNTAKASASNADVEGVDVDEETGEINDGAVINDLDVSDIDKETEVTATLKLNAGMGDELAEAIRDAEKNAEKRGNASLEFRWKMIVNTTQELEWSENGVTVHMYYDARAKIPEGAHLSVTEIPEGSEEYQTYLASAEGAVKAKKATGSNAEKDAPIGVSYARFFDITILDVQENEIQPASQVVVKISYDEATEISEEADVKTVHFPSAGGTEVIDAVVEGDSTNLDGVAFNANGFSVYGIVGTEVLTTQVITAEGESFTIEVTCGPEAEIPSGARLEAREILKGTEEYQKYIDQAKEAMAKVHETKADVNSDASKGKDPKKAEENEGDVTPEEPITAARFFDINIYVGELRIEPKAPVQVNIKYDDAIQLKENELLKAIHFASEGTDLITVDVVESDKGITEVTFEQDSFSVTGTVVQYLSTGWPEDGDYVMIVKPYNSNNYYAVKNDGEITSVNYNGNTGKVTFSDLTSVSQVDDYWWTKSDSYYNSWKYLRAKNTPRNYLDPNESDALATSEDSVARTSNGTSFNQTYDDWGRTIYNYLLVNEYELQIEGQGSENSVNRAVVFFANDFTVDEVPEPSEDPSEVDLGAPGTGKTITPNNDGTYQLALSVTGKSQAQDKKSTADVLVVFDTSGSMSSSRMSTAKSALRTLAYSLLNNNTEENPDTVRMKLISFSTHTNLDLDWVTGSGAGSSFNNGYSTFNTYEIGRLPNTGDGGTNWEEGLQSAAAVTMRDDAAKYVIFVSDGNPTFRVTQNGWNDWSNRYQAWGNGQEQTTNISRCYQMARDDAKSLVDSGNNFYTIGVFGNVDRMKNLTAYAYSGSDSGKYPEGRYQAADSDNIEQAFANIINDINKNFSYTDVEIDDGITALTATALVTGTVNNYEYKISYVDADDGQTHTVNVKRKSDGTLEIPRVDYHIKNADGTTKKVTTNAVTVKGATYDGEKVTWELDKSDGSNYKLENGWTYEVSFTVWPTQRAYDLIADLANGNISYADLTEEEKASIDQATLTLKTNSEAKVSYRQITTTNGVDGTPSDPKTVDIDNPPGVPLLGANLKIAKHWNDDLDPTQLLDLLTDHLNTEGTDVDYTVTLDVVQDKGTPAEEPVHTEDYPNGFVFKPNVTITDGKVTAATWPQIDVAVAPGIMVTYEHAHAHGFDTAVDEDGHPKYRTIEFDGVTYYIIEEGHRYEITERSVDYHFEMMTDIDHLMIIDGVLKNVIHNDDGSIKEISQNPGNLTELGATNSLKGGINLNKYVEDTDGNKITPKEDVFKVKCKLVDENGNAYTRSSETVGDNESDGIVYRVYAPDSELATLYPGKVDTGRNRTVKIGVLDSSNFTVQLKAGWSIRFINVPSNTHWEFEEIDIPTGYRIDTTGTEEVDGHTVPKTRGMTGIAMTNTANSAQITNILEGFETRVLKIEAGTGVKDPETGEYTTQPVKLEGVKFIVKNDNEGDDHGKYLVLDGETITWTNNKADAHVFTTNSDGALSFGKLPLGKYLLTETETKPGYNLLTEDVYIDVTADGVSYQINRTSEPVKAKKKTITEGEKTIVYSEIEVPNSTGTALPHTGGHGTLPFRIAGLALMLMGAAYVSYDFKTRRRRERRLKK